MAQTTDCVVYLSREDAETGAEREIKVSVRVYPAQRATPPSYASGGDPPCPAEAEVEWAEWDDTHEAVDLTEAEEARACEAALLEAA